MKQYKSIEVGKNNIKYLHINDCGREPILFAHGYSYPPSFYDSFLNYLGKTHEIIAPVAYGINNLLIQPTTVDDYVDLTHEFSKKLGLESAHYMGHSVGGSVAIKCGSENNKIEDVVALNPAFPVKYNVTGFIARTIKKSMRKNRIKGEEDFGLKYDLKSTLNILKNPKCSWKLAQDISNIDYAKDKLEKPLAIFHSVEDEYFPLDMDSVNGMQKNAYLRLLPRMNHDWMMFFPGFASKEVEKFYDQTALKNLIMQK